jgi:TolB-like protein/Flp pilus assembly protein TadD
VRSKQLKNIADPIRAYALEVNKVIEPKSALVPAPEKSAPPRLSIVVLPFANLGGDASQEYFVDGVTESLTTDLSRIRGSFVIGRNTAFTYKGKAVDLKQIGRELNVRYVLEGSVQRGGNRMRVNVQLVDAEFGHHLWAERFEKPLADLFDMQDEIVARLAGALNAQLIAAEARRAEKALNPDAMDFYFQGMAWFNKGSGLENLMRAREFFGRWLSVDPDNVDALIESARVDQLTGSQQLVADSAAAFSEAETKLTQALSQVPDHARGHMTLGTVYIWTKRTALGLAECEHALTLDRNLAQAHASIGWAKYFMSRFQETKAHIEEALRLSPRDPLSCTWLAAVGTAKLSLELHEEAAEWYRRAIEANRNYAHGHFVLGVALARLGRLDDARASVKAGLALNPAFSISGARTVWAAFWDDGPAYLARMERNFEAMRVAGVPE